jgi:hypothetical protein
VRIRLTPSCPHARGTPYPLAPVVQQIVALPALPASRMPPVQSLRPMALRPPISSALPPWWKPPGPRPQCRLCRPPLVPGDILTARRGGSPRSVAGRRHSARRHGTRSRHMPDVVDASEAGETRLTAPPTWWTPMRLCNSTLGELPPAKPSVDCIRFQHCILYMTGFYS